MGERTMHIITNFCNNCSVLELGFCSSCLNIEGITSSCPPFADCLRKRLPRSKPVEAGPSRPAQDIRELDPQPNECIYTSSTEYLIDEKRKGRLSAGCRKYRILGCRGQVAAGDVKCEGFASQTTTCTCEYYCRLSEDVSGCALWLF